MSKTTPSSSFARLGQLLVALEWKLYSTLLLQALLPTTYSSVRLHLLGELPSDSGVNIASQVVWLSLVFKVMQELFIMPLYFILGGTINDHIETRNKVKTGFVLLGGLFVLSSGALFAAAPALVKAMAQSPDLIEVTTDYIRIEIFGLFVESINGFLIIPVKLMKLNKVLLISLVLKLILTISLDILLLSPLSFSFQLGCKEWPTPPSLPTLPTSSCS